MPAVYFFLIDVSMNAIQTGATAAACGAINQVIADLPVSFMSILFFKGKKIWIKVFCLFSECVFDYNNAINHLVFNIISFHVNLTFSACHSGTTSMYFFDR